MCKEGRGRKPSPDWTLTFLRAVWTAWTWEGFDSASIVSLCWSILPAQSSFMIVLFVEFMKNVSIEVHVHPSASVSCELCLECLPLPDYFYSLWYFIACDNHIESYHMFLFGLVQHYATYDEMYICVWCDVTWCDVIRCDAVMCVYSVYVLYSL